MSLITGLISNWINGIIWTKSVFSAYLHISDYYVGSYSSLNSFEYSVYINLSLTKCNDRNINVIPISLTHSRYNKSFAFKGYKQSYDSTLW